MNNKNNIYLKDLEGEHILTGVDIDVYQIEEKNYYTDSRDVNYIAFTLDGITYIANEDYNDGYRSCMEKIQVTDIKLKNTFEPVKVLAKYLEKRNSEEDYDDYEWSYIRYCEILQLIDIETKKVVLEVGTDNTDDYYPCFVSHFNPKNLILNQNKNDL